MNATSTSMKKLALAAGLSLATMGSASAALIASWDYTQEFEFIEPISPASVDKSGVTAGVSDVAGNTKLEWGTSTGLGRSSLVINPDEVTPALTMPSNVLTQGNVTTSTDLDAFFFAAGPSIVHNNFVIADDSLSSADAQDYVTLTPFGGGIDQIQNIVFGIKFVETLNSLTGAACPSGIENEFGCGDIFVLSGGLLGVPTFVNTTTTNDLAFLIDSFLRDGFKYDVYLREQTGSLGVLSNAACTAASAGWGCIGWTTHENASTIARLQFGIHATEVPEPGTLALLSGGLMLLGWTLRKKANGGRSA